MALWDFHRLHLLINYLHIHPYIGGLITFGIAFLESIALIGGFIPGSVIMTAMGALIGSGTMPLFGTLASAILGAFCGDFLSYGIGAYYNERLKKIWPFSTHPDWLLKGEIFFNRHGGKSILIGRFFGLMRSIVPLIAGLMRFSKWRFALAAFIAALLWSALYIAPGIVVGALSLELPPATATRFILIVLMLVAFGWIFVVLIHLFFKTLVNGIDRTLATIWKFLIKHKTTHPITNWLNNSPTRSDPYRQLGLACLTLFFGLLFIILFINVISQGILTHFNEPLFELLRSLRTGIGDNLMLVLTLLGDKYTQLLASGLILIWLLIVGYRRAGFFLMGLLLLSIAAIKCCKYFYYVPRPSGLLYTQLSSSFPSGHALLSTAVFSFLAMLIGHYLPTEQRKTPFWVAGFIIFTVLLSRIYLGEHWLIDVLAGFCLGFSVAAGMYLGYLRSDSNCIPIKSFSIVVMGAFLVSWVTYGFMQFHLQQNEDTLYWPKVTMSVESWWQVPPHPEETLFVLSRFGKPEAVLNVQWLGTLEEVRQRLKEQKWQEHAVIHLNWKDRLNRLVSSSSAKHLPAWPALYQNRPPVLFMTKSEPGKPLLYFILWLSNITVANSNKPLWVGSVHYFIPKTNKKIIPITAAQSIQLYEMAVDVFKACLTKTQWQIWVMPSDQVPPIMHTLHWNQKLLLIKS